MCIGKLLGVEGELLYKNICKPRIKVGTEFVTKGMNVTQVSTIWEQSAANVLTSMCMISKDRCIIMMMITFVLTVRLHTWCHDQINLR